MSYPRMKWLTVPSSGSLAGETASRNRYGQYKRSRAIPVNPNTTFQGAARTRVSVNSAAWRALTDIQRAGWESLGSQMSRTDALGQSYTLNGFQAYCSANNNLSACGDAAVSDAPAIATPAGILTATVTATAATLSVAYTATPLAAGVKLMTFAGPQRSPGKSFEGDFRLIAVSAAAAVSPANIFTAYQARLGTPVLGQKIFFTLQTHKGGFPSGPFMTSVIVTA